MSERLEAAYEQELAAIRSLAREFARQHPGVAGRLLISDDTGLSQDPHVERLIEAFAFLTARLRVKLDDEFPELVEALLGVLYPHYLAPIPSMAIAQLHIDPAQSSLTTGPQVPRGTELLSREIRGMPCRFRTTAPATLWPLSVVRARYQSSPFGSEIEPPPAARNADAALRLELRGSGGVPLPQLGLKRLRLFLSGDAPTTHQLYELVMNHVTAVQWRVADAPPRQGIVNLSPQTIRPVGFEPEEGMLAYGPRSFPGYALLTEYFAFPQKFLFFDLEGLEALGRLPAQQDVELLLFLDRTAPALETRVSADTFRLHCVPIVNLFSRLAEPIRLTRTRSEYLVVPDARRPEGMEVIAIESVESVHPDTKQVVTYTPFYALDHADDPHSPLAYWHARRRPSLVDSGTDVYLSLVDRYFQPHWPASEVLSVRTTCSNRNWPGDLQKTGAVDWQFQLAGQFPVRRITTPVEPTPALRLPQGTHRWRLVSHLMLNHLSITGGPDGAAALREILRLYDYTGSSAVAQQIEGIAAVESARGVAPIREGPIRGFCRGLDVTITFDDDKYPGTGFFLLASVLERFLGQYVSINAFTRLTARSRQRAHWERRWPPRTGNLTLA